MRILPFEEVFHLFLKCHWTGLKTPLWLSHSCVVSCSTKGHWSLEHAPLNFNPTTHAQVCNMRTMVKVWLSHVSCVIHLEITHPTDIHIISYLGVFPGSTCKNRCTCTWHVVVLLYLGLCSTHLRGHRRFCHHDHWPRFLGKGLGFGDTFWKHPGVPWTWIFVWLGGGCEMSKAFKRLYNDV